MKHEFSLADAAGGDAPIAHALSNGHYTVLLTAAGSGYSALGALAVTRWTPDRTRDADGFVVYVRDVESGAYWSAGVRPVPRAPDRYAARFAAGRVELARADDGVETAVEVCVVPNADAEVRRVTLTNRSGRPRRLDVTTYAEAVLNTPAADASHPAFSKLFVQTGLDAERGVLLAKRRLRSPDDAPLWVAHALWVEGREHAADGAVECETDRMRFLGRGRAPAAPRAMDAGARLSGAVGNVLDPVLALRRAVSLAPGESTRMVAVLAAAAAREGTAATVEQLGAAAAVDDAFAGAAARGRRVFAAAGLARGHRSEDDIRAVHAALGAAAYAHPRAGDVTAWRSAPDDLALFAAARRLAADGAGDGRTPEAAEAHGEVAPANAGAQAGPNDHPSADEPLLLFNGHGGFTEDGTEYVVRVDPAAPNGGRPPLPWSNVVANGRAGFIATESGAGYTWNANSRENRLTPWANDPVSDPHGEALYLRDEETGACWSPTPGPAPAPNGHHEARHGFGYTRWRHASHGLEQDVLAFVPREDPVKVVRLRVTNRSGRPRRLAAFSYAQLVLGVFPWETGPSVETRAEGNAVYATNRAGGEFSALVAFAAAVPLTPNGSPNGSPNGAAGVRLTADRREFLGRRGDVARPAALAPGAPPLSGRAGAGLDPCAAFSVALEVAPGETAECAFLLGQGRDEGEARGVLARYGDARALDAAFDEARDFWRDLLGGVRVETPSPALDLMVNGWLSYQNLSCRVWGRSAYYQSGGAFGFRDQLQDASALLHLDPAVTRRQIVLHAEHQFVEGDVLHWWHPPASKGIRTRFADDLLWLPYVAAYYVEATGDASVLDEAARFVTARPLAEGEDEAFVFAADSGERASVYEHCCRALDRSLATGEGTHGLPLMGVGDWNDGMNRVGREGRGESVWMGFFLVSILDRFAALCEARGDAGRAERYRAHAGRLAEATNADGAGWDGGWYRRAYYDDGTPLGAASNDECQIDTIAQAWAVIARAAPPARAEQALDAMERHLVSEREGIIRLLTPAFDRTPHDPGYIKGYLPGVRENGGQYTHAALWAVKALAELGRADRAAPLLEMLSPASRGGTAGAVAAYQTEPYVIAADVYGVAPHVGRGGWTWYTGSAGWMFRVALESVLGLTVEGGDTMVLRPCVPAEWPGFTVRYRLPDRRTVYEVVAARAPNGETASARVDGGEAMAAADGAVRVPLVADGQTHRVALTLGDGLGPRYRQRE